MNSITITKVKRLKGTVKISGSKNAAIPIICSSLLRKKVVLYNVPKILDIKRLIRILAYLGSNIRWTKRKMIIDNSSISYKPLTIEECSLIRGSYYLIPIMLFLFDKCEITLPGGCSIGQRPIDAHIHAIKAMGYIVKEEANKLIIKEAKIPEKFIYKMSKDSVGASINTILLALKSKYSIIDGLIIEPEGMALIEFLKVMGYNIDIFNKRCVIREGKSLNDNVKYRIIPDRIEAMTFIIMGLLCGDIKVKNINIDHMKYPIDLLKKNGFDISINNNVISAKQSIGRCFNIETKEYPFFPTDMQSLFGVLFAFSRGSCIIEEKIFENRMQIYTDLLAMGADINVIDNKAYLVGGCKIQPMELTANDLRHGAALLVLALKIGGKVNNVRLINRGYEEVYYKIEKLGAQFILD